MSPLAIKKVNILGNINVFKMCIKPQICKQWFSKTDMNDLTSKIIECNNRYYIIYVNILFWIQFWKQIEISFKYVCFEYLFECICTCLHLGRYIIYVSKHDYNRLVIL